MHNRRIEVYTDIEEFVRSFPERVYDQTDNSGGKLFFISCSVQGPFGRAGGDRSYSFNARLQRGRPELSSAFNLSEYHTSFTDYNNSNFALKGGMKYLASEIERLALGLDASITDNGQPHILLKMKRVSVERASEIFRDLRRQLASSS